MPPSSPRRPLLALALLLPAPSLGVVAAMVVWPDTASGRAVFALAKGWVFALPALWFLAVDGQRPSWSPPRLGGFRTALLSGLAMAAVIVGAYAVARHGAIDTAAARAALARAGLARPSLYLGLAAYWILVNSVLEEYLWRWFVVREAEALWGRRGAVLGSALGFTAHHVVAAAVYLAPPAAALVGVGVGAAGAWWSWMYLRYRSVWPGWVSHALADVAVFACGAHLIFGA